MIMSSSPITPEVLAKLIGPFVPTVEPMIMSTCVATPGSENDSQVARIQMSRQHPWRADNPDAVNVARPSKWGNPFRLRSPMGGLVHYGPRHLERFGREWDFEGRISANGTRHDMWFSRDDIIETHVRWATRAEVVELFRLTLTAPTPGMLMASPSRAGHFAKVQHHEIRTELAGKDLACWCQLGQPCHADVLLELANR